MGGKVGRAGGADGRRSRLLLACEGSRLVRRVWMKEGWSPMATVARAPTDRERTSAESTEGGTGDVVVVGEGSRSSPRPFSLLGGYVWVVRTGFSLDRGGHLAPLTELLPGGHGRAGAGLPEALVHAAGPPVPSIRSVPFRKDELMMVLGKS